MVSIARIVARRKGNASVTSLAKLSVWLLDGVVRIRRETKGRKGKGVTTISGVPLTSAELKVLAKRLKQRCGTGGAIKEG